MAAGAAIPHLFSYWHDIMPRHEGDIGNSHYWHMRVGRHPVLERSVVIRRAALRELLSGYLTETILKSSDGPRV